MYKKLRKLTALLIAGTLAIAGSLLPASADGTSFSGGTGTASDPYLISSADDLVELSELSQGTKGTDYVNKYYKMTADIDLNNNDEFNGIGSGGNLIFTGTFDGDCHIVKNFSDNKDGMAGFFNVTQNATIKNLGIVNADLSGNGQRGAFTSRAFGKTVIDNCFVRNLTINASDNQNGKGAFAGNNSVAELTITNSYASNLNGAGIGGIFGNGSASNSCTLTNVYTQTLNYTNGVTMTNTYQISSSESLTDDIMDCLMPEFAADTNNVNSGLPVLAWEEVLSLAITDGKAEVINNSAVAANGVIAIAAYDSNNTMLEVCATKDVSVKADGRDELSYTAVDGAKYYKVFLWKDMTDLAPLCGTATLTK